MDPQRKRTSRNHKRITFGRYLTASVVMVRRGARGCGARYTLWSNDKKVFRRVQLTLAFITYTTCTVYVQNRSPGGPKGQIKATMVAHSSPSVHSDTIITVTEFEPQLDALLVQKQQEESDAQSDITAIPDEQSPLPDENSEGASNSQQSPAPDSSAHATEYSDDGTSVDESTVQDSDSSDGDLAECTGQSPIAKSRRYPIRYPLSTAEYPLAEGVYSNCKVHDVMAGDLEDPDQLEAIAKARSFQKEIIIVASNAAGAKITFNLLLSLQAQGISHVVWLTDDPTYCKALFYSPMRVACAHTSYLQGHPGWVKWYVPTCKPGGKHCHDAVGLWLGRLRYVARLASLGYNPLYLDTDFTAQDNIYKYIKSPLVGQHSLHFMREGVQLPAVNIGYIYCQNCSADGRSVWVLEESLRRIEELLNLPRPAAFFDEMVESGVLSKVPDMRGLLGPKKMLLDQAHVDDVIETSVHERYSKRRTIACVIPYELGKQVMDFYRWNETNYGNPAPGPLWSHDEQGTVYDTLHYPTDAPEETVGCPPTWMVAGFAGCFNSAADGGVMGRWPEAAPPLAHYVGAPDKHQIMKFDGTWNYDADALTKWTAEAVIKLREKWGDEEDEEAAKNPTDDKVQARLQEEGEAIRAEVGTLESIKEQLLAVPLLGYLGPKIRHKDVYPTFTKEYFQLLADLVVVGAIAGSRQGIVPPVDCDSEWLERRSNSPYGVSQGPWRWDYREGEQHHNGAGVSRCTGVAPGAPEAANTTTEGSTELCCFPYLTGNAVFPFCSGSGLGMYHHVDVEHLVSVKGAPASDTSEEPARSTESQRPEGKSSESSAVFDTSHQGSLSVVVIDLAAEGLTGTLQQDQVERLRGRLQEVMDTQLVYLKVPHWTHFPHVAWKEMSQEDRSTLEQHFRKCPLYADYIRGVRSLPPAVPKVGPYG